MNRGIGQIAQMMQQLMPYLPGYLVPCFNGELGTHRDVYFGMKPMSRASDPDFRAPLDPGGVADCMSDLIDHLRGDPIEKSGKDRPSRFPGDAENGFWTGRES